MNDEEIRVLNWCKQQIGVRPNLPLHDFSHSWSNGIALNALIHSIRPEVILLDSLLPSDVYENINSALDIAQQLFNIPNDVSVEDIVRGKRQVIYDVVHQIYIAAGGDRRIEPEEQRENVLEVDQDEDFVEDGEEEEVLDQTLQEDGDQSEHSENSDVESVDSDTDLDESGSESLNDEEDTEDDESNDEPPVVDEPFILQWCRQQTRAHNVEINDFEGSWKNGIALSALVNSLRPGFIDMEVLQFDNGYENINQALEIVEQAFGIETQVDVMDFIRGNKERIFGTILEIYHATVDEGANFSDADVEENNDSDAEGENVEETSEEEDVDDIDDETAILRWCQQQTSYMAIDQITNFDSSWTSGMALNALLHQLKPQWFDFDHLDPTNTYENIANALDVAHTCFGVSGDIEVMHFTQGNRDKIYQAISEIYFQHILQDDEEDEIDELDIQIQEGVVEFDCPVCIEQFDSNNGIKCRPSGQEPHREGELHDEHWLCYGCLQESANALCTGGRLANFGVGLLCVERGCSNIYPWGVVSEHLTPQTKRVLEGRILNEALMFLDDRIERCKRCAFAVELLEGMDVDPVFDCIECGARFCRRCKVDWKDHIGQSCDEVSGVSDRARKELEEDLSTVKIRTCHRCKTRFAKEDGCNSMTCPCGATQCYCCRAPDIQYRHFCSHPLDEEGNCRKNCGRKCILFADDATVDGRALLDVTQKAERDELKKEHIKRLG